jgi:hypothetical protein
MNFYEFYNRLYNVSESYHWHLNSNNKVVATIQSGPNRGHTLNPVTALAHKSGFGFFDDTRDGTEYAASLLGIPRKLARSIYSATVGTYNRGNTQVVRGRIRSALGV